MNSHISKNLYTLNIIFPDDFSLGFMMVLKFIVKFQKKSTPPHERSQETLREGGSWVLKVKISQAKYEA